MEQSVCTAQNCDRPVRARGWCGKHYENWRARGRTEALRDLTVSERLQQIGWTVTASGCWEWKGPRNDAGYGLFTLIRKGYDKARVHRVVYAEIHGKIPNNLVIRHRCDNPPCVNPAHLLKGIQADNASDMRERGRRLEWEKNGMKCSNGHDVSNDANVTHIKGRRTCLRCKRDRSNRYAERKRNGL